MINGIQHIGIGVKDRERAFDFYSNALGFSVPISKHTGSCNGMIPILGKNEYRNVVISLNPFGGGLVEIFQYTSKAPVPIPKRVDFSYNGYLFYGLITRNIEKSLNIVINHGGEVITQPTSFTPMKNYNWRTVVYKDRDGIYGILLEYPKRSIGYGNGHARVSGIEYVAVGVSDLKRSTEFYSQVLNYNQIIYEYEGECPEWDEIFGKGRKIKRVLLRRSRKAQGVFRHFLRGGMIELIEAEGNKGRHNYEGRKWGDIGLMEICFDVTNVEKTIEEVARNGNEIVIPPHSQDMGMNTHATFAYIKDPDGSLVEFADIKSLPVPYFFIRTFVNPFTIGIAKKLKLL